MGVAKADCTCVQILASSVFWPGLRPEQAVEQSLSGGAVAPTGQGVEAVTDSAFQAGAGKHRMLAVALAGDGVVDQAEGLAGAHVDRAGGVEEEGGVGLEHGGCPSWM